MRRWTAKESLLSKRASTHDICSRNYMQPQRCLCSSTGEANKFWTDCTGFVPGLSLSTQSQSWCRPSTRSMPIGTSLHLEVRRSTPKKKQLSLKKMPQYGRYSPEHVVPVRSAACFHPSQGPSPSRLRLWTASSKLACPNKLAHRKASTATGAVRCSHLSRRYSRPRPWVRYSLS